MAARAEMPSLSPKPIRDFGLGGRTTVHLFTRGLAQTDQRGVARPVLAERLPELNTETWRLFPDGRMETTYRLRPGLTWHDGAPLVAEDFIFARMVYGLPELGHAASPPIQHIEEMLAPDHQTVVIRWRRPWVEAGALETLDKSALPPLPPHILADPLNRATTTLEPFAGHPYWSTEYVGTGPYRLERWESGSFLEGTAFDGYALGRPKIDRVRVRFISDPNAVVANILAGEVHITVDSPIAFQQGLIVKREWAPRNAGTVLVYPVFYRWITIQQRAEFANPRSLRDVRVRKALAHAIDKSALNEGLFEGEGLMADSPIASTADAFPLVDRATTRYGYDLRRAEQLMGEVGYTRGADGTHVSPAEGRFSVDLSVLANVQNQSEMSIMGVGWRQAGFDIKELVWPQAAGQDTVLRNTHPGLSGTNGPSGQTAILDYGAPTLPRPENRWLGSNRGGWSNGEFDRLVAAFNGTLVVGERNELLAQMVRLLTEDAAFISLWFNPTITAYVDGLTGPVVTPPEADLGWNVHEWEFRRQG